ncbi:hypothetical protein Dimus_007664, partial [Dionaea muscipula]
MEALDGRRWARARCARRGFDSFSLLLCVGHFRPSLSVSLLSADCRRQKEKSRAMRGERKIFFMFCEM